MNQSPRPKMRTLAQREAERQRARDEKAAAPAWPVGPEPRKKGRWEDVDEEKLLASIFPHRGHRPEAPPPVALCRCGSPAEVNSKAHGVRCRECYDELTTGYIAPPEPPPAPLNFGQRRCGRDVEDPSPWRENAVRDREGD